jgi:hypothetical protein
VAKRNKKDQPMLGADGKPIIFKADKEHQSLTKQANEAWLASMLDKQVETTVQDADGNATTTSMPFNEFAAEKQLRHKKYEFTFPGRSRAKFLAGKPYEEVSPPKQVVQGKKVQSGDIEITKSDAYLEKRTANRLENIEDEYMKNRNIPNSTPSKPKKTEPTLAERTRVGRKDMA